MTHFDVTIKTEPLSPESAEQLVKLITTPTIELKTESSSSPSSSSPSSSSSSSPSSSSSSSSNRTDTLTPPDVKYPVNAINSTCLTQGYKPALSRTGVEDSVGTVLGIGGGQQGMSNGTRNALKSSILNKRRAKGEMALPWKDDNPREYKLTKREIERREARKEQNRRAARRCRIKKKKIQLEASQEMQMAVKENVNMKNEVRDLREQVNVLQKIIRDHEINQHCKLSQSKCSTQTTTTTTTTDITNTQQQQHNNRILNTSTHPSLCFQQQSTMCSRDTLNLPLDTSKFDKSLLESVFYSNHQNIDIDTTTNSNNNVKCSTINTVTTTSPQDEPQNLPSWDLNYLKSDLEDVQMTEEIFDVIKTSLNEDSNLYETPKLDSHSINPNDKSIFSYPENDYDQNKPYREIVQGTHKSQAVRNLNTLFMESDPPNYQQQGVSKKNVPLCLNLHRNNHLLQDDIVPQCEGQIQNDSDSAFQHNLDISSPVFPCVSPNLVQQVLVGPSRPTPNNGTSNATFQNRLQQPCALLHEHSLANQLTNMPSELKNFPFELVDEMIPNNCSFLNDNISSNSNTSVNTNNNNINHVCNNNNLNSGSSINTGVTNSNNISNSLGGVGSFAINSTGVDIGSSGVSCVSPPGYYSYSPISVSSPSTASTLSSPGFMQNSPQQDRQNSPHEICDSQKVMFDYYINLIRSDQH